MTFPPNVKILPLLVVTAALQFPYAALAEAKCELGDARQRSAISELCPFRSGLARIQIAGRWGFIDIHGKLKIDPRFDEVQDFSEGLAAVQLDGQWGLIDQHGGWVVRPSLEDLAPFSHGLASARANGKYGYIDASGKWIIAAQYHGSGDFSPAVAVVRQSDSTQALIERSGRVIKRFAREIRLDDNVSRTGLMSASVKSAAMLVHVNGTSLPFPDGARHYSNGLFIATGRIGRAQVETEAFGLMDTSGTWLVPPGLAKLEPFEGALAIAVPYTAEKQDPLHGLIDRRGAFIVKPVYQSLRREEYGYQAYKPGSDDEFDVLSTNGKLLFTVQCNETEIVKTSGAVAVMSACDRHWLIHRETGLLKRLDGEWRVESDSGHLLLTQRNAAGRIDQFEMYDGHGKRVAASDAAHHFFSCQFSHITLAGEKTLPVAVFGDAKTGAMGILTRDYQLVTGADWEYDGATPVLDGSSGDPAEGPLVMKGPQGFGAVDERGIWVVLPNFARLSEFQHGLAFATTAEGKAIVVDAAGHTYPVPEHVDRLARTSAMVLTAETPNGRVAYSLKDGAITALDAAAAQVEPDDVGRLNGGMMTALKDGKFGLMNEAKAWVLPPSLPVEPKPLMHGRRLIGWSSSDKRDSPRSGESLKGLLDPQGRELIAPRFTALNVDEQSGLLIAQLEDGLHSVLAADGTAVLAPVDGKYTGLGDGWFKVEKDEQHGLIDQRGDWVVKPGRTEFKLDTVSNPHQRLYAIVGNGPKRRLVDTAGRESTREAPLELPTDEPSHWWWSEESDDKQSAFYGYDFKQRARLPGKAAASEFSEGTISFKPSDPKHEGKVGLTDDTGRIIGLYAVDEIDPMVGGMAKVSKTFASIAPGGRPAAAAGVAVTRYGFINRMGKLVVPVAFEAAGSFSENRATVVIDSGLALIDDRGRIVLQGAWQCGRTPVLMDDRKRVVWPDTARTVTSCRR